MLTVDGSFCMKCKNGTYSPNGSTVCSPCPDGYFADKVLLWKLLRFVESDITINIVTLILNTSA